MKNFAAPQTDVIQAEARKNGLRYNSKYMSLEQRDREIANSGMFRKSLYDFDVENSALAHVTAAYNVDTRRRPRRLKCVESRCGAVALG